MFYFPSYIELGVKLGSLGGILRTKGKRQQRKADRQHTRTHPATLQPQI